MCLIASIYCSFHLCSLPLDNRSFVATDHLTWYFKKLNPEKKEFKCHDCLKQMPFAEVKSHYNSHNRGEFQCFECAYDTSSYVKIRRHMVNSHPEQLLFVAARQHRTDRDAFEVLIFK